MLASIIGVTSMRALLHVTGERADCKGPHRQSGTDDLQTNREHLTRLHDRGVTRVASAVGPGMLQRCISRLDSLLGSDGRFRSRVPMAKEVQRILERDECFAGLMDLPSIFPIVDAWFNGEASLGDAGIGQGFFARARAQGGWHRDGGSWIRCTFLLSDLEKDGGATAFVEGTHHLEVGPPQEWNDREGQPYEQAGMMLGVGQAGDCIINVTSVWHTNTPNQSDRERRVIWLLYKPASDPGWDLTGMGYALTTEFVTAQSDPLRARLCGRAQLANAREHDDADLL